MLVWPERVIAIVPVFNHAARVGRVVGALRSCGARVLAVDDGSTDRSAAEAEAAGATLIHLSGNQGKAAALQAGFAAADDALAAVTVDADGQHLAVDALALANAAAAAPASIHIGVRDMGQAPWTSRCGRRLSNAAVRLCGGGRVGDSQSGLRAYPLPAIRTLSVRSRRYAWEVEVLIAAARAGIAIEQHPVSVAYPADRVSHFATVRDSLRLGAMVLRMVCAPRG